MNDVDLQELVSEIMDESYLVSLAIADQEGVWVADVIFVRDEELNIYWLSKDWRRHSKAIENGTSVACTITSTKGPEDPDKGLQMIGQASRVDEIDYELVKKYFSKRNKPEPVDGENVIGDHFWYKLVPTKIELIYGPMFGNERQTFQLNNKV
ncbi:MAG: hypothetical protein HQ488_02570 [Parcubacteria group bacterium]|nr:hypothetical protein [Parcubacteria group bacterium]